MCRHLRLSVLLLGSAFAAGCLDTATEAEGLEVTEQENTYADFRVYNIVEAVLPAGNYDGVAGNECVALLNPEHRLRKIILVAPAGAGGSCALSAYTAGSAFSFVWGDTSPYSNTTAIAALRTALGDDDGAAHTLLGATTSEATALASLQSFLTLPNAQQGNQIKTFTAKRVHSLYDFEGQEEVYAEAAYQSVRITQPCENPGSPRLDARYKDGFVYGYTASNTGSCHSGWFSMLHIYNRNWVLVATQDYGE
ncbi:MAG TPA: hypothetical protein VK932_23305 [Kofleriaceae bacterium]|nr:hypothetical protein [Kofleriaceae bacterium]